MTYAEKLKDPRWQKKRLAVLSHARFRCQLCGARDKTLHVHHSYYARNKEPWQQPTGSMISLCESCHDRYHGKRTVIEPKPEIVHPVSEPVQRPLTKEEARGLFAKMREAVGK